MRIFKRVSGNKKTKKLSDFKAIINMFYFFHNIIGAIVFILFLVINTEETNEYIAMWVETVIMYCVMLYVFAILGEKMEKRYKIKFSLNLEVFLILSIILTMIRRMYIWKMLDTSKSNLEVMRDGTFGVFVLGIILCVALLITQVVKKRKKKWIQLKKI